MESQNENLHSIKRYKDYTKNYQTIYVAEIQHEGLGIFKIIRDKDPDVLTNKINSQFRIWDDKWLKKIEMNQRESEKKQKNWKKRQKLL